MHIYTQEFQQHRMQTTVPRLTGKIQECLTIILSNAVSTHFSNCVLVIDCLVAYYRFLYASEGIRMICCRGWCTVLTKTSSAGYGRQNLYDPALYRVLVVVTIAKYITIQNV